MLNLILLAAFILLLPSMGVTAAIGITYALERHRDRQWARDFDAWEVEL